ncbi:MAG TPA: DedA family protein [Nitrospirales bacterium]|nr:DedA family protein [Nitrospirales bacterium]
MQNWIATWFQWVHDWGYPGIVILMAMESSIVPIPSEVVIPPAAYWAAQGRFSYTGVIVAGTVGSYLGAAITYWVARIVGRPLLIRYGRYVAIPEEKLARSERWLARYEAGGVFFARLVPVVRHLIGIPAGLVRMPFGVYSLMTIVGAGLWCAVLAWFGGDLLGSQPDLLNDPTRLVTVLRDRSWLVGGFAVLLCVLYLIVMRVTAPPATRA